MSLNTLSNELESYHVNNENGWGVDITFTTRKTNTPQATRAFARANSNSKKSQDLKTVSDSMDFLSVALTTKPVANDYIVYLGETWIVNEFINSGSGMYDIYCYANKRSTAKKTTRES